ncbi:MAG TPA: efflux RND transporter periplasmic adaptor subunit [Pseudolabrys sp.]|jgi:multidrug efflux system membrane fusion protein
MTKLKLALGAATILAAGAALFISTRGGTNNAVAAPPAFAMPVPVADVVKKTLPIYLDYSARTESIRNVGLQAKIAGYVQEQPVADGADVEKDTLLYKIDPRDYQAALDQAKAQLARDSAALDYANALAQRGTELAKTGALAKDMIEQRVSAAKQAEATLAADEAAVRQAENNLAYTEIRAPFAGRFGRNKAPVGTLITANSAALNTIVQLDPIYVTFNPSETDLGEIVKSRSGGSVVAEVLLPGETEARHKGALTFIDNAVDSATGTITARATIENKDFSLLPGQYVRVRLRVKEQPDTLMVPQVAVGSSQMGKYLYVVGEGNKVERRPVTLGPTDAEQVSVLKGIAANDKVITGNLQKIGPGALVQPLPQAQHQADATR